MVLEVINQKKIKIKRYTLLYGFIQLLITPIKEGFKKRKVTSDATVVGNSAKPSLVREDKIFVSYQSEMRLYGHPYHHGDGCVYFQHHLAFGKMNDLPVPVDLPGRNNSFF